MSVTACPSVEGVGALDNVVVVGDFATTVLIAALLSLVSVSVAALDAAAVVRICPELIGTAVIVNGRSVFGATGPATQVSGFVPEHPGAFTLVSPAGSETVTVVFNARSGPLFLTRTRYVSTWPTMTGSGLSVSVSARLALTEVTSMLIAAVAESIVPSLTRNVKLSAPV